MTKYFLLLLSLFVSICNIATAQTGIAITGNVVTADGQPAENISIMLKGTKIGSITNSKGEFVLHAPEGNYRLIVSSIVHHRIEIPIKVQKGAANNFSNIKIFETERQLHDFVVTGTRTEKRLSEAPIQTTVITQREIVKSGSASTIEALQDNIPGLIVSPNAMGNNMSIKGLNTRYILVLVDGERLVSEGAGGNINFDQIDVSNIKRIEMVNGASSVLYGSNAVGAVINIITKEPIHKFEGGANIIAESHNTWRAKLDGGVNHKKFSARANAFRNSSDGFGGDGKTPYAASYEDYGGALKLEFKPTNGLNFGLNGRYFRHETFNPSDVMNVVHPLTHSLSAGAKIGYVSPDGRNQTVLSSNIDYYLDMIVLENKNNESKKNNSANYISNRLLNTFTMNKKWEFVGGLEHNSEKNFSIKTMGELPTSKQINDLNVFVQADYKPIKKLNIVAGTRYTYNNQFKSALTPKLSIMYRVGDFKFRAGSGSAFRAPSIKELYYDFDHQGMFWIYGNPNLKAEKGWYNSISTEYDKNIFNASVSLYYNKINNKITQYSVVNSQNKTELYYANVSSATLRGIDLNAAITIIKQITLKANYSFTDAVNNQTQLQIQGNVKHSSTMSATWNGNVLNSPFSIQLAGRFSSPQIYQRIEKDESGNQVVGTRSSKALSVWKLTLVKPIWFGKHMIELTAKADNIFNFKDESFVNPGRQYMIGVRYSFK